LAIGKERRRFYHYEGKNKWLELRQFRGCVGMAKIPNTDKGVVRKKLVPKERQRYQEVKGKSKSLQEANQMAFNKNQSTNTKVDQEIALYLPLLNFRQKWVVLLLTKEFASTCDQSRHQNIEKYPPELKIELDSRSSAYKNGKARMISSAESKKRIGTILKPRKVK
jgi:hypothetical protein